MHYFVGACFKLSKVFGQRQEVFANGNYSVHWEVDKEMEVIHFNVTAKTLGFVGFGISSMAGMTGADIAIGGVYPDGRPYLKDYYGTSNGYPGLDVVQDWTLLDYREDSGETFLYFSRPWNTCDDQDVAITEDTQYFIWSFGETDDVVYHGAQNRGGVAVNILDPAMPPVDTSLFEVWTLKRDVELPAEDTVYWCTMHKRPAMNGKQHIVGFSPKLTTPEALKHTHHFTVSSCKAPSGEDPDEFFATYLDTPGGDCFAQEFAIPLEYCRSVQYVFAVGGKALFFPDHVGYPINEQLGDDYIMFQIHYDNPEILSGVSFEAAVDMFYTGKLRAVETELLLVGHTIAPNHVIPPQTEAFTTVGHCSTECTTNRLPDSGVNVFNIMLHSHLAGRKLKLRHFRGNEELPWIANDENYAFDYQQNRPLKQEVKILPGDQLTYECITSTIGRDGVTLGGLSSRDEMCEVFIWYYPKQNLDVCSSGYLHMDRILTTFGIQNMTSEGNTFDPTVLAPPEHVNKRYSQVLSEYDWAGNPELKAALQQEFRFSEHLGRCFGSEDEALKKLHLDEPAFKVEEHIVKYPSISEPYVPSQECNSGTSSEKAFENFRRRQKYN